MSTQSLQKPKQRNEGTVRERPLAPFGEFPFFLGRIRDEFERLLDHLPLKWPSGQRDAWRWGVEVEDEEGAVVVRAEAPGFEADDFDIRVSDNRLILQASRKQETKDKEGKLREYRERECYESVVLPAGIDQNKVEAKYRNGILTVTLPKTAEGKAKRVAVKSE